MPFGINNLTQKTNPNEANKSFVLGVPPLKRTQSEANKCFGFGIPFENEPKLGPKIC